MMFLRNLLENIYIKEIPSLWRDLQIHSICCDSRKVNERSLFITLPGVSGHGEQFVADAISRGAKVIVTGNHQGSKIDSHVCHLRVEDTRFFLKELLLRFYGNPSHKIKTIGITGTNGKTTLTYLLESILTCAGKSCGVIGTINHHIGPLVIPAKNTTPGLIENMELLSLMLKEGADYCAMEVSSHALTQGRVDLINFRYAVFTNLTSDHLDYHKTQEEYFLAKAQLFTQLKGEAVAIINVDDPFSSRLIPMIKVPKVTYGINTKADVMAEDIDLSLTGSTFTLVSSKNRFKVQTQLIGLHNISNILAAACICLKENIPLTKIKEGIERLTSVPGRLEQIKAGQDFVCFIDFAHTEDALKNVLRHIRQVNPTKILLVFGCGGDRDKTKRPRMGKIASQLADWVIITNDNPRTEDPKAIVDQILSGFEGRRYTVIIDREEAIKKVLNLAKKGDVVIIAGKGHEEYQIFKDRTTPFNEREIVIQHLKNKFS